MNIKMSMAYAYRSFKQVCKIKKLLITGKLASL